jgi:lysophospholipase L1-like esterase
MKCLPGTRGWFSVWGVGLVMAGCQGLERTAVDPAFLAQPPGSVAPPGTATAAPPIGGDMPGAAGPPASQVIAPPPVAPPPPGAPAPRDQAAPRPERFVVLGDSIAACSNLGGKNGADCSPGLLYDYLKVTYAPDLVYENYAVGGAVSADVVHWQLPKIPEAPGHALVLVYVGGNDLARYLLSFDVAAERGFIETLPKVLTVWELIISSLNDSRRFPDGYTLIMNNQYNPFDDCTAAPYFMSERKNQLLRVFNDSLAELAERKEAVLVDQYTPYLGHGHHHAVRSCPHYRPDTVPYMGDLIHPNQAGHRSLFLQWQSAVDRLYAP